MPLFFILLLPPELRGATSQPSHLGSRRPRRPRTSRRCCPAPPLGTQGAGPGQHHRPGTAPAQGRSHSSPALRDGTGGVQGEAHSSTDTSAHQRSFIAHGTAGPAPPQQPSQSQPEAEPSPRPHQSPPAFSRPTLSPSGLAPAAAPGELPRPLLAARSYPRENSRPGAWTGAPAGPSRAPAAPAGAAAARPRRLQRPRRQERELRLRRARLSGQGLAGWKDGCDWTERRKAGRDWRGRGAGRGLGPAALRGGRGPQWGPEAVLSCVRGEIRREKQSSQFCSQSCCTATSLPPFLHMIQLPRTKFHTRIFHTYSMHANFVNIICS